MEYNDIIASRYSKCSQGVVGIQYLWDILIGDRKERREEGDGRRDFTMLASARARELVLPNSSIWVMLSTVSSRLANVVVEDRVGDGFNLRKQYRRVRRVTGIVWLTSFNWQ